MTSDDNDTARLRRRLLEAYELLKSLRQTCQLTGIECEDLAEAWHDLLDERWREK